MQPTFPRSEYQFDLLSERVGNGHSCGRPDGGRPMSNEEVPRHKGEIGLGGRVPGFLGRCVGTATALIDTRFGHAHGNQAGGNALVGAHSTMAFSITERGSAARLLAKSSLWCRPPTTSRPVA